MTVFTSNTPPRFGTISAYECPGAAVTARGVDDPKEVDVPKRTPNTRICSIEGCTKPSHARGWCQQHYKRWKKFGDPLTFIGFKNSDLAERVWSKVDKNGPDGCWLWTSAVDGAGYGRCFIGMVDGKPVGQRAHRVTYELERGPIPAGMEIDHLCRNPPCVNPDHLEPVTTAENQRRGVISRRAGGRINSKSQQCSHILLSPERRCETRTLDPSGLCWHHAGGVSRPHGGVAQPFQSAKLTEDAVRAIRSSTEPVQVLADRFGVSTSAVWLVRWGKTWAWVA